MTTTRTLTRYSFSNPIKALEKPSKTIKLTKNYPNDLHIRTMTFDEVEWSRIEWAGKGEGWSSSVGGLLPNYNQDNEGFYIMELNGEKMGSISMITYPGLKMAYVGYFIIREPHRGKGFGRILFEEVLNYTQNIRGVNTFGLTSVESATPLYEKFGFQTYTQDNFWSLKLDSKDNQAEINDEKLKDISLFPKALYDYDKAVYGDSRPNFLHAVCSKPSTITIVCEEEGKITGYGVLHERIPAKPEPNKSYRIGPMYANNLATAADILKALIASATQTPSTIYLETPDTNPTAAKLMSELGFTKYITMPKMYRGSPPKQVEMKIFCYSSVAFG